VQLSPGRLLPLCFSGRSGKNPSQRRLFSRSFLVSFGLTHCFRPLTAPNHLLALPASPTQPQEPKSLLSSACHVGDFRHLLSQSARLPRPVFILQ
jgi:hypothetical protein